MVTWWAGTIPAGHQRLGALTLRPQYGKTPLITDEPIGRLPKRDKAPLPHGAQEVVDLEVLPGRAEIFR